MSSTLLLQAETEVEMQKIGTHIACLLEAGTCVFFQGDLGVGKTTLCRSIIQALGVVGRIKSPTYTLVEPYELERGPLYHFDLYRLADASELEYLGYRDYFNESAICLVEWPERGEGYLDPPDVAIRITALLNMRELHLCAFSERGTGLLSGLASP